MKTTRKRRVSRRTLLRGGLLAGLAALGGAVAAGQGSAQAPPPQPGTVDPLRAPISLGQAVAIAEKQTGGRARKAEMERERGVYVYEIETVSKDGSGEVYVDPTSGNVLRASTPGFVSGIKNVFDRDDQREDQAALARLESSSTTLAAAIDLAEKAIGGRAVKAELKARYGSMVFGVGVVKDWTTHRVLIDPATAKVVTGAGHGEDEDDD